MATFISPERNKETKTTNRAKDTSSFGSFLIELGKIVLIALAIIVPVRYFLVQPFYVKGASMEPTFHDHEYLLIDEITYRFSDPGRGDIVVLRYPRDPSQFFIKRIIGLPGERVEVQDGSVIIYDANNLNGFTLTESYLVSNLETYGDSTTTVGSDEFFVMGDNRTASLDSRSFGTVQRKYLVGRAWLRIWPFIKFKHFTEPSYSLSGT